MNLFLLDEDSPKQNKFFNIWIPQKDINYERVELTKNIEVCIFTDFYIPSNIVNKIPTKYKVAFFVEPRCIKKDLYSYIDNNPEILSQFDLVITHDDLILKNHKNSVLHPFLGGSYILEKDWNIYQKDKTVSLVASEKNWAEGHKLRHLIAKLDGIDCFGPNYKSLYVDFADTKVINLQTLYNKTTGNLLRAFKSYRYSFAIENMKQDRYFSEKLINCFLTGTIPIYWGARNIAEFFNTDGILEINDELDAKEVLRSLSQNHYDSKKSAIMENFERAKKYASMDRTLVDLIRKNLLISS